MDKYINADVLALQININIAEEMASRRAIEDPLYMKFLTVERDLMTSEIEDAPAADVAPVVHGEWLLKHIGHGHYWECSVCHTNPCIYVTEHTKFCPNCGAMMDEEKEK